MLKHSGSLLNKTVTTLVQQGHTDITQTKRLLCEVLPGRLSLRFTYCLLILFALTLPTACGANDDQTEPATLKPQPAVALLPTAVPTVTSTSSSTPRVTPTLESPSLIPTATHTLVAEPTVPFDKIAESPLATSLPTIALIDMLSRTIVVTATNFVTTAELSPTSAITITDGPHPAPPIAAQPVLGPQPTLTPTQQVFVTTTLAELQPDGTPRTAHIPILMYHYVSIPPVDADLYRRDLSVPPELFAAHLDRMIAEGYTTITLYDLTAHLLQGAPLPAKPVLLTFDDGYRDNYENAYPLLHQRQMEATFFIVIDFIDRERPEYLTWDMVREMYAGGMSIEVHGVDHSSLRNRSQADLEFQALRSYETIRDRIGVRPYFLSYPAGEYDTATIEIFRSANYWAAVTTVQGATHSSDKLFELQRVRIRNTTTPDELIRLLQLDW